MIFRPMQDRILVREREGFTPGGIALLPNSAANPQKLGVVIAVGEGTRFSNGDLAPVKITKGEIVMFSQHVGEKVKIAGEDLVLLHEGDVLGVFYEEKEQLHAVGR